MPIDVHAHYVPPRLIEVLRAKGAEVGATALEQPPGCHCIKFEHGQQIRPFFERLTEPPAKRIDSMLAVGIERQVLSVWTDIAGYGLSPEKGAAWHRLLNGLMSELCQNHSGHFSLLASCPLQDAARAAREVEHAVRQMGAVGAVVACNIEGVNLGDAPLDEFWAAMCELDLPVFLHPVQPVALPRTSRYGLAVVAQYTFDTTATVGSMFATGVFDRFPRLRLILSHGGGTIPYLIGRFDCMYQRQDHKAAGITAKAPPSTYFKRLYYDTILHHPRALRYLAELVGTDAMVLGSDDPFPPADHDPLSSLRAAGFSTAEIHRMADTTPRQLFRLPA